MQQRLLQQPRGGRLGQAGFLRQARADHRAHALGRQFEDLHVRRPGRLGEPEHGVQAGTTRIELALAGGQLQAQVGEGTVELVQPRDEPARQQAAGYAEDERGLGGLPAQLGTDATQSLERIAAGVTQANAGIGEFYAASILAEQGHPEIVLEQPHLPAHGAMCNVQFLGRQADAVQPGSGFESAQGIQGREVAAHGYS